MRGLLELLRSRLALRSAALTLLALAVIGAVSLAAALQLSETRERSREHARLGELLDTVERTLQIACFLNNQELAEEVAVGLLGNRSVGQVRLLQGERLWLERGGTHTAQAMVRSIASPFVAGEEVCRLLLVPDTGAIRSAVWRASLFTGLILLVQLVALGAVVVLVILKLITRPITDVARTLRDLDAERGEKLAVPPGNQSDELGRLVRSVNGMIDRLVASLNGERELRLRREIEERRYRTIFDNVEAGIFELDLEGRLLSANPAFRRMFHLHAGLDLGVAAVYLQDLAGLARGNVESLLAEHQEVRIRQLELQLDAPDHPRWVSLLLNHVEQGHLQGVANDITERQLATREAERIAVTDPLTGLGNRRGLMRRLSAASRLRKADAGYQCTLVLLDLDRFKAANDRFGHAVGDIVLQHVGRLLVELVRKADYVARLGGDEFVVLLEWPIPREGVEAILSRFLSRVNEPIRIAEDIEVSIGASLGVAVLGSDAGDEATLLELADAAMYRAKREGRNIFRFHESSQPGSARSALEVAVEPGR